MLDGLPGQLRLEVVDLLLDLLTVETGDLRGRTGR